MADLDGAVAVVTGASGKLGPVWTAALRQAVPSAGIDLEAADGVEPADVTDRQALAAALERITADHGVPSVLVNNAGIDQPPDPASAGERRSRHSSERWT